jgi:septum formation protein
MPRIVLASASPRRRELLAAIGISVDTLPMDVDETAHPGERADRYVLRVCEAKRDAALARLGADVAVIAGDTSVVCDGAILGKPEHDEDARAMLIRLVGRSHQVMTAVAVSYAGKKASELVVTEVDFRAASEAEIARYVATGEGRDKAGAYAIQGIGAGLVRGIRGSYGAVVGLPQVETLSLLREVGALAEWP